MANTTARGVFSAIKASLSAPPSSSIPSMPAMSRLARARLPTQRSIPISTLPATQTPLESRRSPPSQPSALQRIASARLGTAAFPQPVVPQTEVADNVSDESPMEHVANARPSFHMGCKPVRDTEVDDLRWKVKGELRNLKDDLGRGNDKLPEPIAIPTQEVMRDMEAAEHEVATLKV